MNRGNGPRRAALILALLALAAVVSGASALGATTQLPKQLTGKWRGGGDGVLMTVLPSGEARVFDFMARFSHVSAHRLTISGVPLCSGKTGRYHWKVAGRKLTFKKIHDTCKEEVDLFTGTWSRA